MKGTLDREPGATVPEPVDKEPLYMTARFWKRFSVFFSIGLSIASLILSSYASLVHPNPDKQRVLTVAGIIINSISISIAALTSLDWKRQATHNTEFASQLCSVAHIHEGERVLVATSKDGDGEGVQFRTVGSFKKGKKGGVVVI